MLNAFSEEKFWHIKCARDALDGLSSIKGGKLEGREGFLQMRVILAIPLLIGDSKYGREQENLLPLLKSSSTTDGVDQT